MTVTKTDLAARIAKKGYHKYAIKNAIDDVFGEIISALEDGDKVMIRGFGTFEVKTYGAHAARHPETKEAIVVPSFKNVTFRQGEELTRAVRKE